MPIGEVVFVVLALVFTCYMAWLAGPRKYRPKNNRKNVRRSRHV